MCTEFQVYLVFFCRFFGFIWVFFVFFGAPHLGTKMAAPARHTKWRPLRPRGPFSFSFSFLFFFFVVVVIFASIQVEEAKRGGNLSFSLSLSLDFLFFSFFFSS